MKAMPLFQYIDNCMVFHEDTEDEDNEAVEVDEAEEVDQIPETPNDEEPKVDVGKKQTVMTDFFTCKP